MILVSKPPKHAHLCRDSRTIKINKRHHHAHRQIIIIDQKTRLHMCRCICKQTESLHRPFPHYFLLSSPGKLRRSRKRSKLYIRLPSKCPIFHLHRAIRLWEFKHRVLLSHGRYFKHRGVPTVPKQLVAYGQLNLHPRKCPRMRILQCVLLCVFERPLRRRRLAFEHGVEEYHFVQNVILRAIAGDTGNVHCLCVPVPHRREVCPQCKLKKHVVPQRRWFLALRINDRHWHPHQRRHGNIED
ncbi:hypothetical protein TCSYLVIO_002448 [Trypanosoma cruzi]|nr:hypothetical protein TCSYLVIO_002448 [Trypanosoma cruzi]